MKSLWTSLEIGDHTHSTSSHTGCPRQHKATCTDPAHKAGPSRTDALCSWQRQDVSPFVMHATHQIGGWEAKRHRLREAGLWNDVQEYYETGRYIEIQDFLAPTRPPTFKKWPTDRMVEFHMAAIRQQLGQVWARSAGCMCMEPFHVAAIRQQLGREGSWSARCRCMVDFCIVMRYHMAAIWQQLGQVWV